MKNQIYPCLWFDGQAQEAANFYCTVFKDSKILNSNPMVVNFELKGEKFMALNGGPQFNFNESVSLVVDCENQPEIDYYWESLTKDGGSEGNCGWLKDKFGVSWQIVPTILSKLMSNSENAPKVIEAFLKMKKFNIEQLENA